MLSFHAYANECVRYFSPYLVYENLNPADHEGDYYANFHSRWRINIRRHQAHREALMSERFPEPEIPHPVASTKKDQLVLEAPIRESAHGKIAQYLNTKHILITNTNTGTTYEFQSDLPIRGQFSQRGTAWIIVHKDLDVPKLQLWRFTRIRGNLIEITLDKYFDGAVHVKNSISPVTGHEIVTLVYDALVGMKEVTMILSIDVQTGKIIFHDTWP